MELERHTPEVIVWFPELLDEHTRDILTQDLRRRPGIQSAVFCPIRHHLMLVQYDPDGINSQDVLRYVTAEGTYARLVGPI
jgi:hypothetical protein